MHNIVFSTIFSVKVGREDGGRGWLYAVHWSNAPPGWYLLILCVARVLVAYKVAYEVSVICKKRGVYAVLCS